MRVLLATSYGRSLFVKCDSTSLYVPSWLAPPVNWAQFTFVYRYRPMCIFCCETVAGADSSVFLMLLYLSCAAA